MEYILAPSILGADFTRLGEEIKTVAEAGAEYIHLDVMDGAFVPSISFGMPVIQAMRKTTDKIFDVHMMVEEPGRYIADMKNAGADLICVHEEACCHLDRTLHQIKEAGLKAGVALNPATPVEALEYVLPLADMALIMSVNPGFGGQKFIPYATEKVRKLRAMAEARGLLLDIQVDVGVTLDNDRELLEAGTNILVAGSAVFKNDAAANVAGFLKIFKEFQGH